MSEQNDSTESRILSMMKKVLTTIAKDTHTAPGMRHPLSDSTINDMRACLDLIVSREAELNSQGDNVSTRKPRFIDEPSDSVVVQLNPRKPGDKS